MDIVPTGYVPGDPRLIEQIVYELKSQGIFDQFRKECIADVDTKPAYQNLRQRVEGSVTNFLKKQKFSGDMNKNQIREQLRKNISESGFLEIGVERIVNQVVNPKINTVFLPKVEDVVYRYLGLERPSRDLKKELKVEVDLLPQDLEAVSPESVHGHSLNSNTDKKEINMEANENSHNSSNTKTEDESPPFEPLEENTKFSLHEDNVEPSEPTTVHNTEGKELNNLETFQDVSQSSKNSHDLSIEMSEENSKMEICEDSNMSEEKMETEDNKPIDNLDELKKDNINEDVEKKCDDKKDSDSKVSDSKKYDSRKSYDKHKSRGDRNRKDEKDKRSRSKSESKSKDHKDYKTSSKHSSSKDRDKDKRDHRNGKDKIDGSEKSKSERSKDGDKGKEGDRSKDKNNKNKEIDKDRAEKEKDKSLKDKDKSDKSKNDKEKSKNSSSSSKYGKDSTSTSKSSNKDKEKNGDKPHDRDSVKLKENLSKEKDVSKNSKDKDKCKSSSSSNSKDKMKDKRHGNESKSKSSDKYKKSSDKDKSSCDKKSSSSRKDKDNKKSVDDHYSSKEKKSDRRSTDRDSNDGSSKTSRQGSFTDNFGSKGSSKESSEVFSSGSGDSNNSDKTDTAANDTDSDCNTKNTSLEVQTIKYNKPKFASNIHEAMKIMKIRKQLARLERKNQLSLTDVQSSNVDTSKQNQAISPVKLSFDSNEEVEKTKSIPESPLLKSKELSMESFEALEARLAQEMSTVDCSMYGEEDDNFEYASISFSPIKKRKSQGEADIHEIDFGAGENQSSLCNDEIKKVESVLTSHIDENSADSVEKDDKCRKIEVDSKQEKELIDQNGKLMEEVMNPSISDYSNGDNEKENKLQNTDVDENILSNVELIQKNGKKCFFDVDKSVIPKMISNLQDKENITDSGKATVQESNEPSISDNNDSRHWITNSLSNENIICNETNEVQNFSSGEESGPCYYFDTVNSKYENYIKILNNTIKKLEIAIQKRSLEIHNNIPRHKKRGRKRKAEVTENNNKILDVRSSDLKKRHLNEAKPEHNRDFLFNSDVSQNQNFSLPLSPAESDKSGEHKKEEPLTVKTKRTGRASVGRGNERYSNEDLYKPRPVFNYTSSRRRGKTEQL